MKLPLVFSAVMSLVLASFAGGAPALAQELFPDEGLEAAVREQVFEKRRNDEPLTKEDVKRISEVTGKGKGIQKLEGLQHCVELQAIDLDDNEISDLSPIADLELLLTVNFAGNQIESIAPVKDLERLQYLELSGNQIKDITPLSGLTNMRSLYLSGNKIEDLTSLDKLSKVWTLYIDGNPVKDWSPIGKLQWLSTLKANNCGIEDLSFLKPLTELNLLLLENNKINDLAPLVEMAEGDEEHRFAPFWRIYLAGNPLDGDDVQQQMETLKKLGARIYTE